MVLLLLSFFVIWVAGYIKGLCKKEFKEQ